MKIHKVRPEPKVDKRLDPQKNLTWGWIDHISHKLSELNLKIHMCTTKRPLMYLFSHRLKPL